MSLRTRHFGAPPLYVSELALGTWGLSGEGYGPVEERTADETIARALELGITLFETSDAYGKGAMEARLGRALKGHESATFVATRHGVDRSGDIARKDFRISYLEEAFARSQERLGRECIDVYMLHNPGVGPLVDPLVIAFLNGLKTKGFVRAWGVAAGDSEVARVAIAAGAQVVSMPYNVLFSRDVHEIASVLANAGAGLFAHSVLSYGLLGGMWYAGKTFPEGDHRRERWTEGDLKARLYHLEAVRSLLGGDVLTLRSAALRYVLSNASVTSAVIGPRNVSQLDQLVRETGAPPYLETARLARLPNRLATLGVDR